MFDFILLQPTIFLKKNVSNFFDKIRQLRKIKIVRIFDILYIKYQKFIKKLLIFSQIYAMFLLNNKQKSQKGGTLWH